MSRDASNRLIIFDLDGTLIDSFSSIISCFEKVLKNANLTPIVPLDRSLIGPPLRQTLMKITGLSAGEVIENMVAMFQDLYDTSGYRENKVYPGIEELLSSIKNSGLLMSIATNKRRTPTLKILQYLGWNYYFQQIGTLDNPSSPQPNKAALLRSIVADSGSEPGCAAYVGDTWEDGEAATANGITFFAAGWGYGHWKTTAMRTEWNFTNSPEVLNRLLMTGNRNAPS